MSGTDEGGQDVIATAISDALASDGDPVKRIRVHFGPTDGGVDGACLNSPGDRSFVVQIGERSNPDLVAAAVFGKVEQGVRARHQPGRIGP